MCGSRFIEDVNSVIGTESFTKGYYHNMLSQYLNINIVS